MDPAKPMKLKEKLDPEDVFCIACRCIYLRPVTMPCGHTLCLECFKNMVNITSYQCPTCRKRISNWLRKYKHNWDSLVNEKLWDVIQLQYPEEVQKRLNDEDDGLEERIVTQCVNHVPIKEGEIRKEFEDMKKSNQQEQDKLELKSLELIKQLQEEEEADQQSKKVLNAELTQNDINLALAIQDQINFELQQEQISINESDMQIAMQLQDQISLEFEKNNKQTKHSFPKKSPLIKGPLDIMFSKLSSKTIANEENISLANFSPSTSFAQFPSTSSSTGLALSSSTPCTSSSTIVAQSPCTSSSTTVAQSPCTSSNANFVKPFNSPSGFNSDSYTSISTTSNIVGDGNLNVCNCGRLYDNFDSKLPPCEFCTAQITLFENLMQQKTDFKIAQDLDKKNNFDLGKKRLSPFQSVAHKKKKRRQLSEGQQTLKQMINQNKDENVI